MQLFPNGDFLLAVLLFCREILAHLICKQIQQSGIASVNKNVLLFSTSGNCLRPCFIFRAMFRVMFISPCSSLSCASLMLYFPG